MIYKMEKNNCVILLSKNTHLLSDNVQVGFCNVDPIHCGSPKQVALDSD
jgi:hypothetical protein